MPNKMSLYTNLNFLPIVKSNFGENCDKHNDINTNEVSVDCVISSYHQTKAVDLLRKSALSRLVILNQFDTHGADKTTGHCNRGSDSSLQTPRSGDLARFGSEMKEMLKCSCCGDTCMRAVVLQCCQAKACKSCAVRRLGNNIASKCWKCGKPTQAKDIKTDFNLRQAAYEYKFNETLSQDTLIMLSEWIRDQINAVDLFHGQDSPARHCLSDILANNIFAYSTTTTNSENTRENVVENPFLFDDLLQAMDTLNDTANKVFVVSTNAVEKAVESTNAADKSVESSNAPETAVESSNSVEKAVELTNAADKAVESSNATEKAIESSNSVEKAVEPTIALKKAVECSNAIEKTIESTNAVKKAVESSNAIEKAVESNNALEESIESTNALEKAVESTNALENPMESTNTVEKAAEFTNAVDKAAESIKTTEKVVESINSLQKFVESTNAAVSKPVKSTKAVRNPVSLTKETSVPIKTSAISTNQTSSEKANLSLPAKTHEIVNDKKTPVKKQTADQVAEELHAKLKKVMAAKRKKKVVNKNMKTAQKSAFAEMSDRNSKENMRKDDSNARKANNVATAENKENLSAEKKLVLHQSTGNGKAKSVSSMVQDRDKTIRSKIVPKKVNNQQINIQKTGRQVEESKSLREKSKTDNFTKKPQSKEETAPERSTKTTKSGSQRFKYKSKPTEKFKSSDPSKKKLKCISTKKVTKETKLQSPFDENNSRGKSVLNVDKTQCTASKEEPTKKTDTKPNEIYIAVEGIIAGERPYISQIGAVESKSNKVCHVPYFHEEAISQHSWSKFEHSLTDLKLKKDVGGNYVRQFFNGTEKEAFNMTDGNRNFIKFISNFLKEDECLSLIFYSQAEVWLFLNCFYWWKPLEKNAPTFMKLFRGRVKLYHIKFDQRRVPSLKVIENGKWQSDSMLYAAKMLNMFLIKNKDMKRVEIPINKMMSSQGGYWGIMKKHDFFSSLDISDELIEFSDKWMDRAVSRQSPAGKRKRDDSEGKRRARPRVEERRRKHQGHNSVSKEQKRACDGGPSPGKNVAGSTMSLPSKAGQQNWLELRAKTRAQPQGPNQQAAFSQQNVQLLPPKVAEKLPQKHHQQSEPRDVAEAHQGVFPTSHQKPANFDHMMHLNHPNFERQHRQHWHSQGQGWFQLQQQQFWPNFAPNSAPGLQHGPQFHPMNNLQKPNFADGSLFWF